VSSPTRSGGPGAAVPAQPALERKIGPLQATAMNMTQMCGIGPFVTIPAMVATMGGPQAMFGWIIGALVALADGLIWAELGAAMPGAGGTYLYLREAFQYRTGRLMPFLFVWSAVLFIPLIMSTGIIGLVQYLGYLIPGVTDDAGVTGLGKIIGIGVTLLIMLALFRKIGQISKLTTVLFVVMLIAVLTTIVAAFSHFSAAQAFAFTPGAFSSAGVGTFWGGLGAGLIIAIYDYLGYNTTAYLGGEVTKPGRTIPRSIIFSILGIMSLYFLLQLGVLGSIKLSVLTDPAQASAVASQVLEQAWGTGTAKVITALIVLAAIGSVFAGLLGGSRVPFEAARDKVFLPVFAKLHPKLNLPTAGVLTMGAITIVGSLFTLTDVINAAVATLVIIQSLAQVAAIVVLRRRQPNLERPYRQWLYPVPTIVALVGWVYIYVSATWLSIGLSVGWLVIGGIAYLIYAKAENTWPFGDKEIKEAFASTGTEGAQA